MRRMLAVGLFFASLASMSAWAAEVTVADAWVRGTVAAQKATGAFMTLQASADMRLVGASSTVAAVTEVHEMRMDGDVMKMRPIDGLDLPADTPVALKPGGYHIMLMNLKAPLEAGQSVEITLTLEDANGKSATQTVEAPVRALGAGAMNHGQMKHH